MTVGSPPSQRRSPRACSRRPSLRSSTCAGQLRCWVNQPSDSRVGECVNRVLSYVIYDDCDYHKGASLRACDGSAVCHIFGCRGEYGCSLSIACCDVLSGARAARSAALLGSPRHTSPGAVSDAFKVSDIGDPEAPTSLQLKCCAALTSSCGSRASSRPASAYPSAPSSSASSLTPLFWVLRWLSRPLPAQVRRQGCPPLAVRVGVSQP